MPTAPAPRWKGRRSPLTMSARPATAADAATRNKPSGNLPIPPAHRRQKTTGRTGMRIREDGPRHELACRPSTTATPRDPSTTDAPPLQAARLGPLAGLRAAVRPSRLPAIVRERLQWLLRKRPRRSACCRRDDCLPLRGQHRFARRLSPIRRAPVSRFTVAAQQGPHDTKDAGILAAAPATND